MTNHEPAPNAGRVHEWRVLERTSRLVQKDVEGGFTTGWEKTVLVTCDDCGKLEKRIL